jgi:hypothetical protein
LLNVENKQFDAFDDLGDFFDFIGTLLRRGVLDKYMVWSSYYRSATAYWGEGHERDIIEDKIRKSHSSRWNDYENLVRKVRGFERWKYRKLSGKLDPKERRELLEQELKLPPVNYDIL